MMTSLLPVGNFLKQLLQLNCLNKRDAMLEKIVWKLSGTCGTSRVIF
jgi:hypothetical protein